MSAQALIRAYFEACSHEDATAIASHFTADAVIYDTNIRPMRGATDIGASWVKVRERWEGAVWSVDSFVGDNDQAAIEWSMTGTDPATQSKFTFRGSEHYRFVDGLIAEIRQYWTFDPDRLTTGLVGFDYE